MPVYVGWNVEGSALWPMLFVTVACGAISGFHSLIASGTTSKQLPNEHYARRIGYEDMIMEGAVSVLALLVVAAGLKNHAELKELLAQGGPGPIGAYGKGFGAITRPLLGGFGGTIAIIILNSFILSALETATRIGRYLTQELFGINNKWISTFLVVLLSGWLALSGQWKKIWPIFGAANQLVAALALIVITSFLLSQGKYIRYTLFPCLFMLLTTLGSLFFQMVRYFKNGDWLLLFMVFFLVGLALFMMFETRRIIRLKYV
jgi:carbon starvation protein